MPITETLGLAIPGDDRVSEALRAVIGGSADVAIRRFEKTTVQYCIPPGTPVAEKAASACGVLAKSVAVKALKQTCAMPAELPLHLELSPEDERTLGHMVSHLTGVWQTVFEQFVLTVATARGDAPSTPSPFDDQRIAAAALVDAIGRSDRAFFVG